MAKYTYEVKVEILEPPLHMSYSNSPLVSSHFWVYPKFENFILIYYKNEPKKRMYTLNSECKFKKVQSSIDDNKIDSVFMHYVSLLDKDVAGLPVAIKTWALQILTFTFWNNKPSDKIWQMGLTYVVKVHKS